MAIEVGPWLDITTVENNGMPSLEWRMPSGVRVHLIPLKMRHSKNVELSITGEDGEPFGPHLWAPVECGLPLLQALVQALNAKSAEELHNLWSTSQPMASLRHTWSG